jgi:hypothetical protein
MNYLVGMRLVFAGIRMRCSVMIVPVRISLKNNAPSLRCIHFCTSWFFVPAVLQTCLTAQVCSITTFSLHPGCVRIFTQRLPCGGHTVDCSE